LFAAVTIIITEPPGLLPVYKQLGFLLPFPVQPTESFSFDTDFKFFLEYRCDKIFEIIQQHIISPLSKIKETFYEEIKLDESSNIQVFGKYKNNKADASFNPYSSKIFYKGKVYDSPSAAAQVVKIEFGANQDTTENGWTFWKFTNENGEEKQIDEFREH
jgi:hypothetical protein